MQNKSFIFSLSDVRNGFYTRKALPRTTQKMMYVFYIQMRALLIRLYNM